jgi:transcriptional regulator with XRE-family HTH domain
MIVSERIKTLRNQMNLTQIQLSNLLNIDQCTLSNYETGKRKPSFKICYRLIKIAKLKDINVDIEYLRPDE